MSVWPIYVSINEIPVQERLKNPGLAGLWVGRSKPVMDIFLLKFVEQMNLLNVNGVKCKIMGELLTMRLYPLCAPVDTMARFVMNGTCQCTGYCGCDWCLEEGEHFEGSVRYPYLIPAPEPRTVEHTLASAQKALETGKAVDGVVTLSPLLKLNGFEPIWGFAPEYMHFQLCGNVKQFTEEIISTLSPAEFELVNRLIMEIRAPNQLCRLSKSLQYKSE
ncbi:hypothetical protein QAD02_000526 [Eretmocerus hayati]|uniref:Uncharacterized protein n=1 Tax=Eretmocerus hayati TaxID=131215 RepID=A0ACC2NG92_9HYME|nr:hypothetical protein QAD02_000526 [Eretmocerus hayati]